MITVLVQGLSVTSLSIVFANPLFRLLLDLATQAAMTPSSSSSPPHSECSSTPSCQIQFHISDWLYFGRTATMVKDRNQQILHHSRGLGHAPDNHGDEDHTEAECFLVALTGALYIVMLDSAPQSTF